jgi:hypothetical protein
MRRNRHVAFVGLPGQKRFDFGTTELAGVTATVEENERLYPEWTYASSVRML